MDELSTEQKLGRYERADEFIARYQTEYGAPLPQPWHVAIAKLLLQGLKDHQLHSIYNTIAQVEHEAGRLEARPFNAAAWTAEITADESKSKRTKHPPKAG